MFTDLRHNPSHFTLIITVLSSRLSFLVTNRGLKYVCIVEFSVTDSFGWKSDASFCKQNQWAFFFLSVFPELLWHMLRYFLVSRNVSTILTCTAPFWHKPFSCFYSFFSCKLRVRGSELYIQSLLYLKDSTCGGDIIVPGTYRTRIILVQVLCYAYTFTFSCSCIFFR